MLEHVNFEGWPNCLRLSNENVELIITTDVGPRIIRFGYINGQNLLYISPDDKGKTGGDGFRYYGGHRLWHSPEATPRSYAPDNFPVNYSWNGKTLKLIQDIEPTTGIIKEIEITMYRRPAGRPFSVHILHRLINKNLWDIELAPWAITALAPGGCAILPQEPYIDPANFMLPSRPLVLWHYTQMDDPRWTWGKKYIRLKYDPDRMSEQKLGLLNKQKWCAYHLNGELFVKTFDYKPQAVYSDYGCNNEVWGDGTFIELESLGPFVKVPSQGMVEYTERWLLARADVNETEESIDDNVLPLVEGFLLE
jgi:hypothetical protein